MAQQVEQSTAERGHNRGRAPFVVGIGASAGGVEALQELFASLPTESGAVYVVIQHLSPDHRSLMSEILGKQTDMPVVQAEDGCKVEADTVYLIPPKKNLTIAGGRLHLADYDHQVLNHPIDIFFSSLAEECHERAVAVVLSGTGSDGTSGIRAVKEAGGIAIVQNPESAKFDGMPRSAISTGLVDWVLPPEQIAAEIVNFARFHMNLVSSSGEELFTDEESLSLIYRELKKRRDIDFTHYKRSTVIRRIERRIMVTHASSLADYARSLDENPDEVAVLAKEILIGVTSFFRDAPFFEVLKNTVINIIVRASIPEDSIRVWSAGCSTGEEAYSIAILFKEVLDELQVRRDIKIFATDIDVSAIERAGKGVFPESIIEDVSPERLARFFVKRGDTYVISKEIRQMVIFAPHNMLSDPPFGKLDLICCRNVMIYFQPVLQRSLFAIFHSALKNGGYLFLGKSETANEYPNIFQPACSTEKIYIHNGTGKMEGPSPATFTIPAVPSVAPRTQHIERQRQTDYGLENIYTQFLERFLPASVIVNEANDVIHFFGDYLEYVAIAPGKATFNLFTIINPGLSLAASTALSRSRSENTAVTYQDISVDCPSGTRVIDLIAQPIPMPGNIEATLTAMLFVEHRLSSPTGVVEKYDIDKTTARRIADLEAELRDSQSNLQSTIGELETVNEELQAANEELLTANEELQSSNEELQSVNEELYTVNSEYQQKVDELTMTTNDLSNFLSSTMIGILFIDENFNIRKFTEYVGREFQLMDHDVGRPIQIFAHSFPREDIVGDAQQVLRDLTPIDREVEALSGKCYTVRIAPYRTTENSIKGLVITIIDSLGAGERAQR
ncbi:chemotaxis protein CheB [Collinsella sp. An2]|uniref:chemotaxis protein CheB n=1 Tax=Collinsella sp. An2 TaxID=1965585 RepID=UPI001302B2E4|nr:chemotaxis protein CheB [Collinsella sp. An2]